MRLQSELLRGRGDFSRDLEYEAGKRTRNTLVLRGRSLPPEGTAREAGRDMCVNAPPPLRVEE